MPGTDCPAMPHRHSTMEHLHIFKRPLLICPVAVVVLFGLCMTALITWLAPGAEGVPAILMDIAHIVLLGSVLVLASGFAAIWLFRDIRLGSCASWWNLWDLPGWMHYPFVAMQSAFLGILASIILVVVPVGFAHKTMPNRDGGVVMLVQTGFAVAYFLCVYWPFLKPEARAKIPVMRWIYGNAIP